MKDFTPVPNEWIHRLTDGSLTLPMYGILSYLWSTCTWTTGVWRGEAERIRYGLCSALSVSQINRYLTRLHQCGYITRKNKQGRRGGYVILLNNYAHDEQVLRPTEIKDWRDDIEEDAQQDAYDMRSTRAGDAQQDAYGDAQEMRSNPDIPDAPNVPDVPDEIDDFRNNNNSVVVAPDVLEVKIENVSEQEEPVEVLVAGYTQKEIADQAEACKLNPWVYANDNPAARLRPGFVKHLMEIDPPRKPLKIVDGKPLPQYRQESGQRNILGKGDI